MTRRIAVISRLVGVAVALCLAGTTLSVGGGTAASSTPAGRPQKGHPAESGCGATRAGSTTLTPIVAGSRRTVLVHVPPGYGGSTAIPLVLNLHGSRSTPIQQEQLTGMDSTANADGFIVAYPQARLPDGAGFDWDIPGFPLYPGKTARGGPGNDLVFLTQLVGILEHRYCIDRSRVFATGFSLGATAASYLACDASRTFAAVAPVSGLRHPNPCRAARPVPVVAFHGTEDPINPYHGHGQSYWTYSVPNAARDWAHQNGCSAAAASPPAPPRVRVTKYSGCRQRASVKLYSIEGEGHEWPGSLPQSASWVGALGPQSDAVSANNVMWTFFAAHPMPR